MTTLVALASAVEQLAAVAAPWKDLFDGSPVVSTAVLFALLAALLVGGGLALVIDRGTLRAARKTAERPQHLAQLGYSHRTVIRAIAVAFVSGVLLYLADVETYSASPVFWVKMGLVTLLLGNGFAVTRHEDALRRAPADAGEPEWRRMRATAIVSAALWMATLLAGAVLTNA